MAHTLTWKEIYRASNEAGFFHGVMGAEENASDTIYVDKAAAPEDFDKIALASLEGYLAEGTLDKKEHDFFVALGVRF